MTTPIAIDRALMQRLAEHARLHLPPDRQAALGLRLERVLEAFAALRETTAQPHGDAAPDDPRSVPLRADVDAAPLPLETVLQNAPQSAGGAFVVPRVIDA